VIVVAEGEHGARATLSQARAHCRDVANPSVSFHQKAITSIDPTTRKVSTDQGHYQADVLAVALGADRSTSRGGTGGWSPRRRMQFTSAPDGRTEPTTDATETDNGRKGTEKRGWPPCLASGVRRSGMSLGGRAPRRPTTSAR
jgi:hypothetical protein